MTTQLQETLGGLERRVERPHPGTGNIHPGQPTALPTILDQRQLVSEVVIEVQGSFEYYHAQIYLFDEAGENLILTSGTAKPGIHAGQGHAVPKGRGLVGRAADTNAASFRTGCFPGCGLAAERLLPETKAEVAIPIASGQEVLGVLDVQHSLVNGLTAEDVTLLESASPVR